MTQKSTKIRPVLLSKYGLWSGQPSLVNQMMAQFAGDFRDGWDINLGVGYVNEKTIPGDRYREAVDYVLSHPETYRQSLNYGGALRLMGEAAAFTSESQSHGVRRG